MRSDEPIPQDRAKPSTLDTTLANCGRQYLHTCRSYSIRPFRRPFSPYLTNFVCSIGFVPPLPHPVLPRPPVGRPTAPSWRKPGFLSPAPTLQSYKPAENMLLHRSTCPISETLYFLCPDTCSKRFACHGSLCMQ
jgi:hypothetical protein